MHGFHPIIRQWFQERFRQPTRVQAEGWQAIATGKHCLVAAPTGSGKTLTAFLLFIDQLIKKSLVQDLPDGVHIIYVSPLRALSHDIHRNVQEPLTQIYERFAQNKLNVTPLRIGVRTGDTPQALRQQMVKKPPHILVTTPESLFLLLTSKKAREMLLTAQTLIVDEIHALARDKRGAHFSLTVERLQRFCPHLLQRIGLSATQKPIAAIAQFLVGARTPSSSNCTIVNLGEQRRVITEILLPRLPLSAVCSGESWQDIYEQILVLVKQQRSTIIFVNTRRMAERVAFRLSETLGEDKVTSHHGSLSKAKRLKAEEDLKIGKLQAIVATASLELGIDVGHVDLVIQIGSPRSFNTLIQRIGRSGHSVGKTPKGILVALTRDELIEIFALIRGIKQQTLDRLRLPQQPIDILMQQIIAITALEELTVDELHDLLRRSYIYRNLSRDELVRLLIDMAEGHAPGRRSRSWITYDQIHDKIKGKKGSHLAVMTSGGTIPERGEYRVVLEDEKTVVGSVDEDFALDSMAGSIFLLGNHSWQVCRVTSGKVIVRDMAGAPPNMPFWEAEAPGRTDELSHAVSEIRGFIDELLPSRLEDWEITEDLTPETITKTIPLAYQSACQQIMRLFDCSMWASAQAVQYFASQKAALGIIPKREQIAFERFFDPSGGMQLVIHSCYGMAINKGWGLALRKKFCRSFNFELQASADDNGIVLSLGAQQSFAIESLFRMINSHNVEDVLIQALFATPLFPIRWRWNATRALAILRQNGGQKVPPPLQRFRADDLLTQAFPLVTACLENVSGDIPIPDQPLVQETLQDCLHEAMDLAGLKKLLREQNDSKVKFLAFDNREPSPFCYQLINANPYVFLDDADLQDRRARAVQTRRTLPISAIRDLATLSPEAIHQVITDAQPVIRDAEECHSTLLDCVVFPEEKLSVASAWIESLRKENRVLCCQIDGIAFVLATEKIPFVEVIWPGALGTHKDRLPKHLWFSPEREEAIQQLLEGWLRLSGPISVSELQEIFPLKTHSLKRGLADLENKGLILKGQFRQTNAEDEYCDRRLLARIHRLTVAELRQQIQAVDVYQYLFFLGQWHHIYHPQKNPHALVQTIGKLQAFQAPAGVWENELLPTRMQTYTPEELDQLSYRGDLIWGRVRRKEDKVLQSKLNRTTPISLYWRKDIHKLVPDPFQDSGKIISHYSRVVLQELQENGATFLEDLIDNSQLLPTLVDEALKNLANLGLVSCDGFSSLRETVAPTKIRRRTTASPSRWFIFPPSKKRTEDEESKLQTWIEILLNRYGVLFKDVLAREPLAPHWGQLLPLLRQKEMRGQLRGGRFITGVSGEQYTTEAALTLLRQQPQNKSENSWAVISAADPLNLYGTLTKDCKIPAQGQNRILIVQGKLAGFKKGGKTQILQETPINLRDTWQQALKLQGDVWNKKRKVTSHPDISENYL